MQLHYEPARGVMDQSIVIPGFTNLFDFSLAK